MKKNLLLLCVVPALCSSAAVIPAALPPTSAAVSTALDYDVGLVDYTFWDTVYVGDTFKFTSVLAKNYGRLIARAIPHWYMLFDQCSTAIWEDWYIIDSLFPEDTERVWLPMGLGMVYTRPGIYFACRCTIDWSWDQNPVNDGGLKRIVVLEHPGTEDTVSGNGGPSRPAPSLAACTGSAGVPGATRYTVTGSKVHPGRARPGVYYDLQAGIARKVILVR